MAGGTSRPCKSFMSTLDAAREAPLYWGVVSLYPKMLVPVCLLKVLLEKALGSFVIAWWFVLIMVAIPCLAIVVILSLLNCMGCGVKTKHE